MNNSTASAQITDRHSSLPCLGINAFIRNSARGTLFAPRLSQTTPNIVSSQAPQDGPYVHASSAGSLARSVLSTSTWNSLCASPAANSPRRRYFILQPHQATDFLDRICFAHRKAEQESRSNTPGVRIRSPLLVANFQLNGP